MEACNIMDTEARAGNAMSIMKVVGKTRKRDITIAAHAKRENHHAFVSLCNESFLRFHYRESIALLYLICPKQVAALFPTAKIT